MARKTKKIDPAAPIVGPVVDLRTDVELEIEKELQNQPVEPKDLYLSQDELVKLQISQLTVRAAQAELNLTMLQRDIYLKQIDPEGKLKDMMTIVRMRTDELALGKQSYTQVTKDIEDRLKISLKEFAYNDENGLLQKVDQQ